ncbi:hypothetical protein Mapa_013429 [Marchantia paleacea]|nr:hypothetical protein Mapa_013429 [Marchantia paleacea]
MQHRMKILLICVICLLQFRAAIVVASSDDAANSGHWSVELRNGGVSAMHMTLTHENTVVYFDMTDIGASLLPLPDGHCRVDQSDEVLKRDCWAHAVEYTIASAETRPLEIKTNTWCSSGSFASNGTLIQTGGWGEGYRVVRYFSPCPSGGNCDWIEAPNALQEKRWYASNQVLPNNGQVVVGGRDVPTYEFVPRRRQDEGTYRLPLLVDTYEEGAENNLYPFVYLNSDGTLFIFANRDSILLNLETNSIEKKFPRMPGEGSRNYPSSGSSVILPLTFEDNFHKVEVMVCGGSPPTAYQQAQLGNFLTALDTCGRLVITDANPDWEMEKMPGPRVLSDMVILPTGDVLIINGCQQGTGGWGLGRSPVLSPYLYTPHNANWQIMAQSTVPRMYHSSAVLIPDGRVLVGGSNTNRYYNFTSVMFPTELRIEAFSPPYLHSSQYDLRPSRVTGRLYHRDHNNRGGGGGSGLVIYYNEEFTISFQLPWRGSYRRDGSSLEYRLSAPPFCTHSFSQNQRQLVLKATTTGYGTFRWARITAPSSAVVAPGGYYLLFVVHEGVPSTGTWVQLLPSQ